MTLSPHAQRRNPGRHGSQEVLEWRWRKSSYSGSGGSNCVEVGAVWRKSSYSGNGGANCVEVARNLSGVVAVRDSKDPDGPVLLVSRHEWAGFIARLRTSPGPV
jgi:hypothetical protein